MHASTGLKVHRYTVHDVDVARVKLRGGTFVRRATPSSLRVDPSNNNPTAEFDGQRLRILRAYFAVKRDCLQCQKRSTLSLLSL